MAHQLQLTPPATPLARDHDDGEEISMTPINLFDATSSSNQQIDIDSVPSTRSPGIKAAQYAQVVQFSTPPTKKYDHSVPPNAPRKQPKKKN